MSDKLDAIVQALDACTQADLGALAQNLEETWGVKPPSNFSAPPAPEVEAVEQTEFDVVLTGWEANQKIKVIQVIRKITGKGLKESKEFIESPPVKIREAISLVQAEEAKTLIEEVGGKVEIQ